MRSCFGLRSTNPDISSASGVRRIGRAFFALAAAVALLALLVMTAADDASAQRGGGFSSGRSFGGGGGRSFGGGGRSFGTTSRSSRMPSVSRGSRSYSGGREGYSRRATGGGSRYGRTSRSGRSAGTRPSRYATRPGRGTRTQRAANNPKPPPAGCRRASACPGGKPPATKPPEGGGHRRAGSESGTHRRAGSEGGTHRRAGSEGGTHRRAGSEGGTHRRAGSEGGTHRRAASDGGSHKRYGSEGQHRRASSEGGHRRYSSYGGGHDRRTSFGRTPPFSPPVAPPQTVYDPPTAGGGGGAQPPRTAGGGGSSGRPQQAGRQFGGPPPSGENRYVPDQVLVVLRDDLTEEEIDQFLRDNGLARTSGGSVSIALISVRLHRFRILGGRSVPAVIAELQNDPRGVSIQPNYLYQLSDMRIQPRITPMVRTASGGMRPAGTHHSMQYVIAKLNLRKAHELSRGERVLIAVIDSGVDPNHPELEGTIVDQFDVTDDKDSSPHMHGTAMTGAIVSQSQLLGVAPAARIIAIRAFSPRSASGASGTSWHLALAIDKAVQAGVRIINLSLAGPHDPAVQRAIEEAHARGIILVAAAGNAGPNSPPMFPAAYPEVIAVTATDYNDKVYAKANRGGYVTVAAPGVDVLVATPRGAYGTTTGTSVAAAHISGVIALMLSRNPMLDSQMVRVFLIRSVRAANANGRDDSYGAGFADAYEAIMVAGGPPAIRTPVAGGLPPSTQ